MIPELFSKSELQQPPLTATEKDGLIRRTIDRARLGIQYMYKVREVAGLMRISYDEIQTLLTYYKLDCILVRDTIVRIPWWSFAEYLIDPADDLETALYDYLKTLPHGSLKNKKTA